MSALGIVLAVLVGINYNWWRFEPTSDPECGVGVSVLGSYGNSEARDTIRGQLAAMRRSGLTSMRIFVYHAHPPAPRKDPKNFVSEDGTISDEDRERLRTFVHDIAAAGFSSLEVVTSFTGGNLVFCKREVRGDCFRPSYTEENWRFIEQTARIALDASGSMKLRFDLQNEAAPPLTATPEIRKNWETYLTTIARRFQDEFGSSWLISAPFDRPQPSNQLDRIALLLNVLRSAGLTPHYLELHDYSEDPVEVTQALDGMQALSQRIGAQFVVGETLYHSTAQAGAIISWARSHPASRLINVMAWPTLAAGKCEVPPPLPYTAGPYAELGGP